MCMYTVLLTHKFVLKIDYKTFGVSYKDETLFTSFRNKSSTRYEIAHFNQSNVKVDWYYDDLNHKQQSLSRNTHFKRNDNEINICFSDKNMVSEKANFLSKYIANDIPFFLGQNSKSKGANSKYTSEWTCIRY
jgi:hypothetical protein